MFACEHEGVVPDMLVLGKSLGGAILPIAAVIARPDLDVAAPWSMGHDTHEKNPVTTRAALAVLDVITEEGLVERAAETGAWALDRLREIATPASGLHLPRGRGLLMGVDVGTPDSGPPDLVRAGAIRAQCLAEGLNFKVSAGATLALSPPLIIDRTDLACAFEILGRVVRTV